MRARVDLAFGDAIKNAAEVLAFTGTHNTGPHHTGIALCWFHGRHGTGFTVCTVTFRNGFDGPGWYPTDGTYCGPDLAQALTVYTERGGTNRQTFMSGETNV